MSKYMNEKWLEQSDGIKFYDDGKFEYNDDEPVFIEYKNKKIKGKWVTILETKVFMPSEIIKDL